MPRYSLEQLPTNPVPNVLRDPADHDAKEKCGVFGVWGARDAVRLAYLGLYALQHRGQESAGIAITTGGDEPKIIGKTGMGLVADVFTTEELERLERHDVKAAIGHNRYSTSGGSLACNMQPLLESFVGGQVAVAHNGNLVNAEVLRKRFERKGHLFHTTSDTEVLIHLLAAPRQQHGPDPLAATLRRAQGAFSLVFLFPDRIEAARDPWGWRPLVLGKLKGGEPVVVSETVALDVLEAEFVREIEPGEIVTLSDSGVSSRRFTEAKSHPAHCAFEHVYFANPASDVFGENVQLVRERMGEALAKEATVDADYVMPMPDSGRSAASGYARASGIPYREGIVPNRYVGRTFIRPTQAERTAAVKLKLNVIREIVKGRRLIVVDDSVVRGTTTRVKMQQLRDAGAKEIHLRISCPPLRHPCFFGVDFATREELVAHGRTVDEIRDFLGVDSLHYLSLEGMLGCVKHPNDHYCTACWTGDYRVDVEHPTTEEVVSTQQRIRWNEPV